MTSTLPTGTVTFLFTDIEDSTRLWQQQPQAMAAHQARHDALLRGAIEAEHGHIFLTAGDAFCAAFHHPLDGLRAAVAAQRALNLASGDGEEHRPAASFALRVRMGLHTGAADLLPDGSGGYEGYLTLATAQRVMSVAHGGQILLSQTAANLLQNDLSAGAGLRDLGEHRLKGLRAAARLFQVVAPGLQTDFPPLSSIFICPNNLPLQLSSFVGRDRQITEIKAMLGEARLVTLTGPGGTGKTRLAQQLGEEMLQAFPQGVWIVELAPLGDPSQIIPALVQLFSLPEQPFGSPIAPVVDYLRDKVVLLILDNCEHLIEACARLAHDLLQQCAGLKLLATSREALGVAGERSFHIPPLESAESNQLFIERARLVVPRFAPSDENAGAIARICTRLDGIPLAIELAAARIRLLSPEQIAARLDDRFRLLVGGSRTATPRHQTLRATLDWSYHLLPPEEQRLLRLASVFAGGWTLEALEAVADDPETLERLEGLINKSLAATEEQDGEMRFTLLETIRQYAREKLIDAGEAPAARDRHFDYFNVLSEALWNAFRTGDPLQPIAKRARGEVENFRLAIEWGLENRTDANVQLAANYCIFSNILGSPAEGIALARAAVESARAAPPADGATEIRRQGWIARALFGQGMVGLGIGNIPLTMQTLQEAIDIARRIDDKRILGYSLGVKYIAGTFINAPGGAEHIREMMRIFTEQVEDRFGLSMATFNMARIASEGGDENLKQLYYGQLRELVREMPGSYQVAMTIMGMGIDERNHGNYESARRFFEDGLKIFDQFGDLNLSLVIRSELGHVERQTGNLAGALAIYRQTIKDWQEIGNRAAIAHQLECFGTIAAAGEQPGRAAALFGAAESLRLRVDALMTVYEKPEYDLALADLRSKLGETEFTARLAEGRALTMDAAIRLALQV